MVKTIYVKCDSHSKVNQDKVYLKDVAEVYCADSTLAAKAKTVLVSHLKKKGERKVISVLYIMEQIEKSDTRSTGTEYWRNRHYCRVAKAGKR
ncbi:MAG: stage V sporulation protein AA [Lachnospiraceae bacterium]|nr:stage V sporulation protein AA [Lachnospiraceae bacterium]